MHGIARVRTSEEEKIKRKKERAAELSIFKSQINILYNKRAQNECDEDTLKLTTEVLSKNPDITTLWNYRREILLSMLNIENETEISKYFDSELQFIEICLRVNPKSYAAWHHRMWVLNERKDPNWDTELKLCNIFLKFDERNLHCWNHRRYVVEKANINLSSELAYCLTKIEENFSNYSAWQNRSKLLPKLYPDKSGPNFIEENKYVDEIELVMNAAFTDPNDSSAWFYQRWLIGFMQKKTDIVVCNITHDKSFIAFNKHVSLLNNTIPIDFKINGEVVDGVWKSVLNLKYDVLWVFYHKKNLEFENYSNVLISFKYNEIETEITCDNLKENYVGYGNINFCNDFGSSVIRVLKQQQSICEQLLELEPDSKWALLTLAEICHSINHKDNYNKCKDILNRLQILDSQRINYYKDLMSRWHLEYCLETSLSFIKNGKFIAENQEDDVIKLSNLYHLQYWSFCTHIDLKSHAITECNLPKLIMLQNCQILDLRNNNLNKLNKFPILPELTELYLNGNSIDQEELKYLKCPKLKLVYIDPDLKINI